MAPLKPDIHICPTNQALIESVSSEIISLARRAVERHGWATIALAGGSTPRDLYGFLATKPQCDQIPWNQVKVFWGDERHVPPDHPDSNFRMAHEALLAHVPIPANQVFRISGELPDANQAAIRYEALLRRELCAPEDAIPRFDLILLGMGPDGHTASLFPGSQVLQESTRLVAAPWVEKFQTFRITLTPPVINQAAHVMFLVSGASKADTLRAVLEGPYAPLELPSQVIKPANGKLSWWVDREAAQRLSAS